MAAIRRAEATWSGALTNGSGTVSAMSSGVFAELPVSWAARTESSDGKTSPEELLAEVTIDKVDAGWRVVSCALTVRGRVPGASNEDFVAAAEGARDGCPISVALAGNVKLSVEATLEG